MAALAAALGLLAVRVPVHAVGESAVITLVFPYGTAGTGMGEVGAAIADDASAPFYNPALLGFCNPRWHGGEISYFYEPILPRFGITDLWHSTTAACYQPRFLDAGGFGLFFNYLNFGENTWTDELGRELGRARSYEDVLAASWGSALGKPGDERNALGVSVKYVYSALAPGFGPGSEGIGRTFAVDAGWAYKHPLGFRVGASLLNMGPAIFYISYEETDPLPFTVIFAVGYDRSFDVEGLKMIRVRAEYQIWREIVKNYVDKPPDPFWKAVYTDVLNDTSETWEEELWDDVIHHIGAEITVMNTFSVRCGYMDDVAGWRREISTGFGVSFLNHFQTNWSIIFEPRRRDKVRQGQWRLDLSYYRALYWPLEDLSWWDGFCGE